MAQPQLQDLLEAGVHFGHQTRRWNPKMRRFIFAERSGIYIIDLQKTLRQIQKAQELLSSVVLKGDGVLRLLLRADAQHGAAAGRQALDEFVGVLDQLGRLLEVDDVDPAALGEDEPAHLRVPAAGLVAEMNSGLQKLSHGDDSHVCFPFRFRCV